MWPAKGVALRHLDNTTPVEDTSNQMIIPETMLTNTAEVTMLMMRPTMVIRLGATHIGQRVTNQFQYLGGFTDIEVNAFCPTFAWWDQGGRRRKKSTCVPSVSAARGH